MKTLQSLLLGSVLLFNLPLVGAEDAKPASTYQAKNFDNLLGKTSGLSDDLLKMHFKLYEGYVTNTNKLMDMIQALDKSGNNKGPEFAELKRRLGWEFDGMRLHELYFGNLGGNGTLDPNSAFAKDVSRDFGSVDAWKNDFIATGLMRGIGWVISYRDPMNGKITNVWVNEHDVGHFATASPLLIMDVFEHAYITEYGLNKADYIQAFFKNIDWNVVNDRLSKLQR